MANTWGARALHHPGRLDFGCLTPLNLFCPLPPKNGEGGRGEKPTIKLYEFALIVYTLNMSFFFPFAFTIQYTVYILTCCVYDIYL